MTTVTPTPDPALPPGADPADTWEAGLTPSDPLWRCVWSPPLGLDGSDVRCVVTQYRDGTIASDGTDGPLVYIGADDYLPADARAIAEAIIRAADLADRWSGR